MQLLSKDMIASEQPIGLWGQLADVLGCALHVKRGVAFTFFCFCSYLNALAQHAVAKLFKYVVLHDERLNMSYGGFIA